MATFLDSIFDKERKLRAELFSVYSLLLAHHKVPIIYREFIISRYSGGKDFPSWMDFIRSILSDIQLDFKKNDLHYPVNYLDRDLGLYRMIFEVQDQMQKGLQIKDIDQVLYTLTTLCNPINKVNVYTCNDIFYKIKIELRANNYYWFLSYIFKYKFLYVDGPGEVSNFE